MKCTLTTFCAWFIAKPDLSIGFVIFGDFALYFEPKHN